MKIKFCRINNNKNGNRLKRPAKSAVIGQRHAVRPGARDRSRGIPLSDCYFGQILVLKTIKTNEPALPLTDLTGRQDGADATPLTTALSAAARAQSP